MRFLTNGNPPKLEAACSKDDSRPILTRPWLQVDMPRRKVKGSPTTGRVHACNSYILATIPVEFDGKEEPVSGAIAPKALAEARKQKHHSEPIMVQKDKIVVLGADETYPAPDPAGQYPDIDRLLPPEDDISDFHVGLNAAFLKQLADALGSENVVLEFVVDRGIATAVIEGGDDQGKRYKLPTALRGIRVRPLSSGTGPGRGSGAGIVDGPIGLMMPIRIGG